MPLSGPRLEAFKSLAGILPIQMPCVYDVSPEHRRAQRNVDRANPQAISGACGLHWRTKTPQSELPRRLAGHALGKLPVLNRPMKPALCRFVWNLTVHHKVQATGF